MISASSALRPNLIHHKQEQQVVTSQDPQLLGALSHLRQERHGRVVYLHHDSSSRRVNSRPWEQAQEQ
jgi:hypothetical protein